MIEVILRQEAQVVPDGPDGLSVRLPGRRLRIKALPPAARDVLLDLGAGPLPWPRVTALTGDDRARVDRELDRLTARGLAHVRCGELLQVGAAGTGARLPAPPVELPPCVRLSRFVLISRVEDRLTAEATTSQLRAVLLDARVGQVLAAAAGPVEPLELAAIAGIDVVALLIGAGILAATDAIGRLPEDTDDLLRQRQLLDTAMHARSRRGLAGDRVVGAAYPFLDSIPPTPALKPPMTEHPTALPRPDLDRLVEEDNTLASVMEARRSIRVHGDDPITYEQLAEFLYRTARARAVHTIGPHTTRLYESTDRPYPTGGASYDLEVYLTVRVCAGLAPGFYHYEPLQHALSPIPADAGLLRRLLWDAHAACGRRTVPQVLITLASRFTRLSWKYEGIPYPTTLKNVGVLYEAMYLVATSMGLAPCGLGAGNAVTFAEITGLDPMVESSVGEFMLGTPAEEQS